MLTNVNSQDTSQGMYKPLKLEYHPKEPFFIIRQVISTAQSLAKSRKVLIQLNLFWLIYSIFLMYNENIHVLKATESHCIIPDTFQRQNRCHYCNSILSGLWPIQLSKDFLVSTVNEITLLAIPCKIWFIFSFSRFSIWFPYGEWRQELMDVGSSEKWRKAPPSCWSPIPAPDVRGGTFEDLSTFRGFVSFGIFLDSNLNTKSINFPLNHYRL